MSPDDKARPENLGEGPETRMEKLPPRAPSKDRNLLGGAPGAPKPDSADASGEGDADELAGNTPDQDVRSRVRDTQRDNARVRKRKSVPNPRRRAEEGRP